MRLSMFALLFHMLCVPVLVKAGPTSGVILFHRDTDTIAVAGQTILSDRATYETRILFNSTSANGGMVFNEWQGGLEDKFLTVGPTYLAAYSFRLSDEILVAGASLALNTWHHVAYVYDGSEERLYLDGNQVGSRAATGNIANSDGAAFIGSIFRDNRIVPSIHGYLDTLRISDVARYSGPTFTPPIGDLSSDSNTLLLYNFNEGPGSRTVADLSGNGHTGTLGSGFEGATSPILLTDPLHFSGTMIFNVTKDWSFTQNPNGFWSYNEGSTPLPYTFNPWIYIPETFWANGAYPPAWTSVQNRPPYGWAPFGDIAAGDVIVHSATSLDPQNPAPVANLTWTSPGAGTIDISGTVWDAYHYDNRDDSWGLELNDTILAGRGSIQNVYRSAPAASLTSNLAAGQSLIALAVHAGDVLEFYVQTTTGTGHFVGVDLTVEFTPAVAYSYTGNKFNLFSCGGDTLCATPDASYTSYTTDDFVTAILTFDEPLPGNLDLEDVREYRGFSLTMNDWHQGLTSPDEVRISTDASGSIVGPWSLISNGPVPPNNGIATVNWPGVRGVSDVGALSARTQSYPSIPLDQGLVKGTPGAWTWTMTGPNESALESLTEETDALVAAGTLTADQGDGLLGKLAEVTKSLDSGATRAACGQLQAYIKQVKGFIKAGKLSPQEGQNLIVAAESIRARIGC